MKKILTHSLVLSLIIVAGLTLLVHKGGLNFPQSLVYRLTAPVQKVVYSASLKVSGLINFVASIQQLHYANEELKQQNLELLDRIMQLQEAAAENELLRKQINLSACEEEQLVLANIVGWSSSGLNDYFLIDKGLKEGIREGAAVLAAGNILVGRVTELTGPFAKVRAVTDPGSRVNAIIQDSLVAGLVRGNDGGDLILDLVPQGEEIKKDEMVVTSGLAGLFPQGLLIGSVKRVISGDSQIAQVARIKPAADFTTLRKVFVVNNPSGLAGLAD